MLANDSNGAICIGILASELQSHPTIIMSSHLVRTGLLIWTQREAADCEATLIIIILLSLFNEVVLLGCAACQDT